MRLTVLALLVLVACSSAPSDSLFLQSPSVDVAYPLRGVPDRAADPAVVLLDLGGDGLCTGALLAADVVLTARRCIALPTADWGCPAQGPQVTNSRDLTSIRVLVGDDVTTAVERARGRAVLVPPGDVLCGADIALLMLDSTLDDIAAVVVQTTGAAVGDHVRSVTYAGGQKLVRDHVAVTSTSSRELALGEAPCVGVAGSPAIDESSGAVVGVFSRSGPACGDSQGYDVYTRADVFLSLVTAALAEGSTSTEAHQAKDTKGPVDLGSSCEEGSDCAAGACVAYQGSRYCTRSCSSTDHCPTDSRCLGTDQDSTVCVEE